MESVIKILREQNRYTQVKLAEILGISRQALIKYESFELEPPLSVIRGLAKLFSVNYECLIDNKLPGTNTSEDEHMIEQLSKDFVPASSMPSPSSKSPPAKTKPWIL